MTVVNLAYEIEIGNSGIAFKSAPRYQDISEVEENLENFYVMKSKEGKIIGVVSAEVDKEQSIVYIGPIAVDPEHQVLKIVYNEFVLKLYALLHYKFVDWIYYENTR